MAAAKYLDKTGLTYFWGKIKAWANAAFAAISHTHASSDVTAMTSYSKPNSTSAITTSDTLNQAVGKLEKAIDDADISNTVHISGNEFIGGIKEFGNSYYDSTVEGETGWESSSLIIRYLNYVKGSGAPSDRKVANLLFMDSVGTNIDWDGRLGVLESYLNPEGANVLCLGAYKNEVINGVATRDSVLMGVGYDSNGVKFAYAPPTSSDRSNSTDIVTRGWLASDTRLVHTINNENIDGVKTFLSDVYCNGTYQRYCAGITRGVSHLQTSYRPLLTALDTNSNYLWRFYGTYWQGGASTAHIYVYKPSTTDTSSTSLVVGFDNSEIPFATAPSTSSSRTDGADIVTRDWIPRDTRIVHTTGEETVAGTKVLTSDPYIKKGNPTLHTINIGLTRNTAPSSDISYFLLLALDTNGSPGTAGNRFGGIYHSYATTKANTMHLMVYNGKTRDADHESIAIGYLSDGSVYTYAPHPADSDNSHNIATSYWVRRYCDTTKGYLTSHQSLDSCVKTSGNQTISGTKSFTSYVLQMNSSIVKDTNPSSDSFCIFRGVDKNGTIVGGLQFCWRTDSTKKACDAKIYIDPCLNDGDGVAVVVKRRTDTYSFEPNGNGVVYLGVSAARWNTIFSSSSSISTSDKRLKDNIIDVPSNILDIWDNVDWIQYQMIDAIDKKGQDKARIHNGLIAQDIDKIFKDSGLDITKYGLFCYDEWEEEKPDYDENGNMTDKGREAGNCYSIRYEEALCMEAAYQRRKNKILENRISELERQVSDVLQILQSLKGAN